MSRRSRPAESTVDHADIRGSAEAAFMVMMRRELPLTMRVGLATITTVEDSPSPRPARPLTHSIARSFGRVARSMLGGKLAFDLGADGPDEADEFACEGRDDLACRLALV
jgi:hypothetical protein